jgi:hypothetical protein
MSLIMEKFLEAKKQFDIDRSGDDGNKIMLAIIKLVNELGQNFSSLDGGSLAEIQMKLAGYKFYLSDYIADLQRISESLKMEVKELKAARWDQITDDIKAVKGKVSNKEQIENVLILETKELNQQQILYETMWYKYKLKLSALDDIITAVVQQIAQRKRDLELTKM